MQQQGMPSNYLNSLSDVQKEAVLTTEGPAVIIAGAGSGKTRVLTCRIAHLLQEKKATPHQILALTFTNKAASEMRSRVAEVVGTQAQGVWLGTFHSMFIRILRMEVDQIGYPQHFTIYDTSDSKSLIKGIVKAMNLDEKAYTPNVILGRMSGAKSRLITATQYGQSATYQADDKRARMPQFSAIYAQYATRCFKAGAMDFDDILLYTHQLLYNHAATCLKYQERFRYLLIDEFQDTNMVQYSIVKKLVALHKNICVVGDDAQSIYAFRGADIQNILNFEKDYPNYHVFKLEQNYRSTQHIVNTANAIISHNQSQLKKTVWTANETGDAITLMKAASDLEEAQQVSNSIFEAQFNQQLNYQDFAILYRTNSQSRALEEALRKNNIPYRIVGGTSFYQRKEVKDLVAYLRFVVNANDEEAFKRIINLPKRGVGTISLAKIFDAGADHNIPLWQVLCNVHSFLSGTVANNISAFVRLIQEESSLLENKDAYEIAHTIAQKSGLISALYEDKTVEGVGRYENVQELLNGIQSFTQQAGNNDVSLGNFLQEVALVTNTDQANSNDAETVTLMTIHAAKGLEFNYVYIVGMEEELFPSQMMLGSREDLEEERRLFYVAVTRAQKKVFLSYALSRYRFGKSKQCRISRFIGEIKDNLLQAKKDLPTSNRVNAMHIVKQKKAYSQPTQSTKPLPVVHHFTPSDTSQLQPGMQVLHPQFGIGKVVQIAHVNGNRKGKIIFQDFGEKTLLLNFAKLRILDPTM